MDSIDSESDGSLSRSSRSPKVPEEEWIVIDPRADRDFINNVRKKILECVKTKTNETYDDQELFVKEIENVNEIQDETEEPSRSSIIAFIEHSSLFKNE